MSHRNGDRSRSNAQRRHKTKMRARRRELFTALTKPFDKVVTIDGKKSTDSAKAERL
jgi:hypothetical protein